MMWTPASQDEALETIRQGIDIVELISRYVSLKKTGNNFTGLCPFHGEKTPSFTVSPQKKFFHCFGCKASGDAFSFLMKIEGKSFPEALSELAERCNVELPRKNPADGKKRELKQYLYRVCELARDFYREQLHQPTGKVAREAFLSRGLSKQVIENFELGYAPPGWSQLSQFFQKQGVDLSHGVMLGLLGNRSQGSNGHAGTYDVLRHRLIFPIAGQDGKLCGFGARLLEDSQAGPKYINSRQNPIYDKSKILYGLPLARKFIGEKKEAILVEGYFDVLTLVSAGVEHVVATCGTALTEEHATMLGRLSNRVTTVFDADSAGRLASLRSAHLLIKNGLSVYMLSMPSGEDPDSFVRKQGGEEFRLRLESTRPSIEVLADLLAGEVGSDLEERADAVNQLVPLLVACPDPIRQAGYIRQVAQVFRIGENELRDALKKGSTEKAPKRPRSFAPLVSLKASTTIPIEEEMLAVLLLKYPGLRQEFQKSDVLRCLSPGPWTFWIEDLVQGVVERSQAACLVQLEQEELRSRIAAKLLDDDAFPEDKAPLLLKDCVSKIRRRHLKTELKRLTEAIGVADRAGQKEEITRLQQNKMNINRELVALDVSGAKTS